MEKRKKKVNNTHGITLITLAVTIIILLILAGVTISALTGDDGIIQQSKLATEEASKKVAKEEIKRIVREYDLTSRSQTLEEFLKTKVPDRIDSVINNGDGTLIVTKNGYAVTVNDTEKKDDDKKDNTTKGDNTIDDDTKPEPVITVGVAKVVENSNGTGSALGEASTYLGNTLYITFSHSITGGSTTVSPSIPYAVTSNGTYKFTITGIVDGKIYTKDVSVIVNQFIYWEIGDYVDYTYDAANNFVLTSEISGAIDNPTDGIQQIKDLEWRILNIDVEEKTVDLISARVSSGVWLGGILGYNNGPYLLNEICRAHYSNKTLGVEARNINLLDMEKHLTTAGITARNTSAGDVKYGTTETYTTTTEYPSLYAGQKGAGVNVTEADAGTIEQPDISKGNDPYEESKKLATTEPTKDSTSKTGNPLTVTQTYYNMEINSTNYGNAANVLREPFYWVATRFVNTNHEARFGLRLVGNGLGGDYLFIEGDLNNVACNLRPVVSIPFSLLSEKKDSRGAWKLK